MTLTPQERLTLGVATLLLGLGAVARYGRPAPAATEWDSPPAAAEAPATGVRAAVRAGLAHEREAGTPLAAGEGIDPNTASAAQLERLPRVGPALAGRIVEHRQVHGPFRSLTDLDAVPGIGPAMLANLAPHLALPAGAAPAAASAPRAQSAAAIPAAPERIDLNIATAAELQALPGIGPALAERIVQWRAENGPFRDVADLDSVRGIGPRLVERVRPAAYVGY